MSSKEFLESFKQEYNVEHNRIRKSLNEITKEIKTMKLIDYCLENKVEDRISRKILTEGELRNEYCPTCFIDNIKVLKRRKGGDLQDCVYNDSAKDFGEQCKICWEREMPMIKKRK